MKNPALLFFLLLAPLLCRASNDSAVIEELNLARTRPHEYAKIVEARMGAVPGADESNIREAVAFLRHQRPLDPLQSVPGLVMSARQQVLNQGVTGETGHRGPDGSSPWSRMLKWGQWTGQAGENVSYGLRDSRMIVITLIVDQGVPGRAHRKNIFSPGFKVAGAACGPHPRYGAMCVIDFAGGFAEKGEKLAVADP